MRKRFVLAVETDPVVRHLTCLLETGAYEPVVASSVYEQLAVLAHRHFRFSLLDLDLDAAEGNELLKRLRVQGGDPGAIIVITNGRGSIGAAESAAPGPDDLVQKPFTPEELENAIHEIDHLHPALQGKLHHVLQDGQFSRVGGRWILTPVRIRWRSNEATSRC